MRRSDIDADLSDFFVYEIDCGNLPEVEPTRLLGFGRFSLLFERFA